MRLHRTLASTSLSLLLLAACADDLAPDAVDPPVGEDAAGVTAASPVTRATFDVARCAASADCKDFTSAPVLGWMPSELAPLATPFPRPILANVCDEGGPGKTTAATRITSRSLVFGVNPAGGGYGTYVSVDGGKTNEARFGFGDGWQASIRDEYHSGNWNPTQAGSGWSIGAQARVDVDKAANTVAVHRYNMPNFLNDRYDFLENDAIRKRSGRDCADREANGKDVDGVADETMDSEIRSEFDFVGSAEDVSAAIGATIPALRFRTFMEYTRPPRSVLQFQGSQIVPGARAFVSPSLYENVAAETTDASVTTYSWGMRFKDGSPYRFLGYLDDADAFVWDELNSQTGSGCSGCRTRTFVEVASKTAAEQDAAFVSGRAIGLAETTAKSLRPVVLLANGKNATTSKAFALYYPTKSDTNRLQTVGVQSGTTVKYAEDRLIVAKVLGVADREGKSGEDFYNLTLRVWTRGLFEPRRTMPGVREGVRAEVIVLYGSPAEIRALVKKLEA